MHKTVLGIVLAALLISSAAALAQAPAAPADPAAPGAPAAAPGLVPPPGTATAPGAALALAPENGKGGGIEANLINLSMGGARLLLYVLFLMSILSVAVAIEKYVQYRRDNALGPFFRDRLVHLLDQGKVSEALKEVEGIRGVNAALIREGLINYDEGPKAIEEVISGRLILERARLEKRLIILGTIGNNAPFVGLLGTVMGIIKAFHDLSVATTQGPQTVMAGISEALIATAVGLFVAIPAVILYNWLKSLAKGLLDQAESNARMVLAFVKREAK
jgi:biopolymer transport protein ExbB